MNHRERFWAIMHDQPYDRLPVLHFGYWQETLQKWCREGHLTEEELESVSDGSAAETSLSCKLGFDYNYYTCYHTASNLFPGFEHKVLEELPDGSRKVQNSDGAIIIEKDGAGSIPSEVGHLLTDRDSWEAHYKHRLQYSEDRINLVELERLKQEGWEIPLGLHCGSLFGNIRNWMGLLGVSYLYSDDEPLYDEIIDTVGELCFRLAERVLQSGVRFDFGHFWEDICFKNGPLVVPEVFRTKVGPHYRRITDLLNHHGIDIVSLDCDGCIDALVPIWLENGVNTMFPIEVGTWRASIAPWRAAYGPALRGVGGMDKVVFSRDKAAVDAEIERLKPLVALGGFIPCPDHRLAPDAKWERVQYYCDQMRRVFS